MFKKKCLKCRNKINKNYDFCPFCGNNFKPVYDREDYGVLGKNDFTDENCFPQFGDSMMDKMFNSAFKMAEKLIEKQMKNFPNEMAERQQKIPSAYPNNFHIEFFVNGKRVFNQGEANPQRIKNLPQKIRIPVMAQEKLEKFAKLPRAEPISKMRRLGGKLIYELEVPGVKDIEDVLINRLENSIEIKALADNKSYSKVLNVNFPILRYGLNNGNLFVELLAR